MDAWGTDIEVDTMHLLSMIILDTILNVISIVFVTMILSSI